MRSCNKRQKCKPSNFLWTRLRFQFTTIFGLCIINLLVQNSAALGGNIPSLLKKKLFYEERNSIVKEEDHHRIGRESIVMISQKFAFISMITSCSLILSLFQTQPAQASFDKENDFFFRAEQNKMNTNKNNFSLFKNEERKAKAMQEIIKLQDFQDSRLSECVDQGQDWEQCFMFGDSLSSTFADSKGNDWDWNELFKNPSPMKKSLSPSNDRQVETFRKPPTW